MKTIKSTVSFLWLKPNKPVIGKLKAIKKPVLPKTGMKSKILKPADLLKK